MFKLFKKKVVEPEVVHVAPPRMLTADQLDLLKTLKKAEHSLEEQLNDIRRQISNLM